MLDVRHSKYNRKANTSKENIISAMNQSKQEAETVILVGDHIY